MALAFHVRDDFVGAANTPIQGRVPNVVEGLGTPPAWVSEAGASSTYGLVLNGAGQAEARSEGF